MRAYFLEEESSTSSVALLDEADLDPLSSFRRWEQQQTPATNCSSSSGSKSICSSSSSSSGSKSICSSSSSSSISGSRA